jgi:Asp-tRNA(Asn)/Glu-tRNA(Gln) amidotransferase C subunit
MADVTRDLVRTLAAANGLKVSEERLELVRREYENFLRLVSEIDKMSIPAEAEPAPAVRKP